MALAEQSDIYNAQRMTGMGFIGASGRGYFPDPWFDYASFEMPDRMRNVLEWSEKIWLTNATFRMGCERVVRYFLTKIEVEDVSDEEAEKWKDFLNDEVNVIDKLANIGDDFLCYGNSFISVYIPFDRFLICPKCQLERPIQKVQFQFNAKFEFHAKCPKCRYEGSFERRDRRASDDQGVRLIRWSPHQIIIQYNPLSHDVEYRWRIPEWFKKEIRSGNPFYLRTTHWEFVEAIQNDKLFRFNPDMFYHFKEHTLAGIRTVGWGIPRVLSNFKQAYYIQVLKRHNEALAMDYIVPFRLLTPAPAASREADPILHQNLSTHKSRVLQMISEHRRDPATWHFLPFPVQYQTLGGEGAQMVTHEMINGALDELLNGQGIPAELYKGTIQIQAAPTALRLFQQTWPQLVTGYNGFLNWFVQQASRVKNWEPAKAKMQAVTLADDLEKKQILLQLAAGNQISKQTAFSPFGIDVREETRRMFDEQKDFAEEERTAQREAAEQQQMEERLAMADQAIMPTAAPPMAAAGGAAGGPPGAMTTVGGGGAMPSSTPQDMLAQAESIAAQLLKMPYEQRKSQLLELKKSDEALHALVKSKMESIRQQAQTQGGYQMLQGGAM